jgi:(2Fe-2S) ferredoxin
MFYRQHVFCCTNKRPEGHERGCCIDRGAGPIRDYMKQRCKELGLNDVRINASGCLDRCELGPVMVVYPEGTWYRPTTKEEVDEIIRDHLQGGQVVARLAIAETA